MSKKVSILIPLYNTEKYIKACIDSILNQSYSNIEIIIVDDGSTDNSLRIVQSYSSEVVKIHSQQNRGACAARNRAFEISSGDYIIYFDADDLMSVNKIKNQIEQANIFGDNYVYSSQWISFKKDLSNLSLVKSPLDNSFDSVLDWFKISWKQNYAAQTGIWLTPRSIIEKTGRWNEQLKVNQDGEFFFRVLLNSKGIRFTEDAFVYYRRDVKDSITLRNIPDRAESILQSYSIYENILKVDDSREMKLALAYNYAKFIYIFYPHHKELIKSAFNKIEKLGIIEKFNVGGKKFKQISNLFGFKNALRIRTLLRL